MSWAVQLPKRAGSTLENSILNSLTSLHSLLLCAIAMSPSPRKASTLADLWGLIAPIFRRHALRVALGLVTLIAVDVLQLVIPKFVQKAIDALAAGTATGPFLERIAWALVVIAVSMAVLRFVWRSMLIGFSRILERTLRNQLFAHLVRMDQPFFERRTTGDLMAHASNDLPVIQMAFGMGVVAVVDILVLSLTALGFMITINLKLTLIVLLPMPLLVFCTRKLSAMLHRRVNVVQEQFAGLTEFARATLVAIRLIKTYTLERFQSQGFERLGLDYVAGNLAVAKVQGLLAPASTLVGSMGLLLLLYFGGCFVIEGQVSIGAFVAFISYLSTLLWPMMAVGWVANLAQRGLTSLRRLHRILSEQPSVETGPCQALPPSRSLVCSLRCLDFSYPDASTPTLRNLNLELGPGLTGLTGRTGSGKSTLCKVLLRLYPLPSGMLFFQDKDATGLTQDSIRSQIAWVGQESFLFAGSIADNIALGKPEASLAEIRAAARQAAIDEEIMGFQGGYGATIGERGIKLSGGQKQRLTLARALLCQRPMLIIDDGLSAVDVATEREILDNLQAQECTVLLISHRINVLCRCQRIVILEEGAISACGTHDALIHHPFYKTMLEKQKFHA